MLSEERIKELWEMGYVAKLTQRAFAFARAIEAAVLAEQHDQHDQHVKRIAALEEAAREARDAFEQHDGNYKLSKASGAIVDAAIAKLDEVLRAPG